MIQHENSLVENYTPYNMIMDFFKSAISLKKIKRQGWIDRLSMDNPESVSDHTFSMAVMGMIVSDLEDYDSAKILKMILIHDLAESETGDFIPGQIPRNRKAEIEDEAFLKISGHLPDPLKSQYRNIWREYKRRDSPEAELVHQLDRLEMALQARTYQEEGHARKKLQTFFDTAETEITHPKLKEMFRDMAGDS